MSKREREREEAMGGHGERESEREDERTEAKTLGSPRWTVVKPGFEPTLSNFKTRS